MNAFEKIIGYESIKQELIQICDMIHNKDIYQALGAKLPNGILLYGDPGLGKTLIAKCFIEESKLPSYIIRRNKSTRDFVNDITKTFQTAKENAPAIIFLDDMDKFANEDEKHRDAEEYVAVQAGIDEVRDSDVFILATANDIDKLPESLIRPGRFDRRIEIFHPTQNDSAAIIQHYLQSKKLAEDVNLEDVAMMISFSSCAELETILNEAAITAAFSRKEHISMEDLTKAVLREHYDAPDDFVKTSEEQCQEIALHEAGHLVVSEVLCPGSVGLASIRTSGRNHSGGFVRRCKKLRKPSYDILISLAGKTAVELYYSETCASGCENDIFRAAKKIRNALVDDGSHGFSMLDIRSGSFRNMSENWCAQNEAVVYAELERYMFKARDILIKNREFLEQTATALLAKETLLYSDIRAIRNRVEITAVAV